MDRTVINIVSLLLGGGGLFATLTEYNVPELRRSFWDQNPFALKAEIIRGVMARFFTALALVAILLQVLAEIFGEAVSQRAYGVTAYILVAVVGIFATVAIVWSLGRIGRCVARRSWLPEVIESQRQLFEAARFVMEHDGLREDQLALRSEVIDRENYRQANFQVVENNLAQIEHLLELEKPAAELSARVRKLAPYFDGPSLSSTT